MEIMDEVRSQYNRCHRLAKKHYDEGKIAEARAEYLKCAELLKHLAELSPKKRRSELLDRSQKFREIAEGLKEGTVKVYTSGIMPAQQERPTTSEACGIWLWRGDEPDLPLQGIEASWLSCASGLRYRCL